MLRIGYKKFVSIFCIQLALVISGCGSSTKTVKVQPEAVSQAEVQIATNSRSEVNVDSLVQASIVALDKSDLETADDYLNQAFRIDSSDWRPPYLLGKISVDKTLPKQATRWFAYSLSIAPNEPKVRALIYEAMGVNCEQQGEYGKARLHYTTALQLNPESGTAREALRRLEVVSNISH